VNAANSDDPPRGYKADPDVSTSGGDGLPVLEIFITFCIVIPTYASTMPLLTRLRLRPTSGVVEAAAGVWIQGADRHQLRGMSRGH
jgi:hypothetical protein